LRELLCSKTLRLSVINGDGRAISCLRS
jgi:hypothetical protein